MCDLVCLSMHPYRFETHVIPDMLLRHGRDIQCSKGNVLKDCRSLHACGLLALVYDTATPDKVARDDLATGHVNRCVCVCVWANSRDSHSTVTAYTAAKATC